ncbi:MAG: energy transducer TonB [Sphingomicrobium sp.]
MGRKPEIDPPLPRQAWMMRGTVSLDRHGKIVDCKLSSTGFASEPLFCRPILAIARMESTSTARPPGVVAAFSITDSYFLPVAADKVTIPPELPGAEKIAQQVSEVVIEPDGRISDCKGVRYSGAAGPETDACRLLANARFVPSAPDGEPLTGTILMTVYLEKHSVT